VLVLGLLWTFPYATMSVLTVAYLACIPFSYRRFQQRLAMDASAGADADALGTTPATAPAAHGVRKTEPPASTPIGVPPGETKH
jgi:CDP-diacylglycerol--serine O-phosphatidyltransferase